MRRRCTIKSGAAPAASGRQREEGAAEQGRLSQPGADVDAQPEEVRAREGGRVNIVKWLQALYDFAAEGGAGITAFVGVMYFEVLRVGTGWMASGA